MSQYPLRTSVPKRITKNPVESMKILKVLDQGIVENAGKEKCWYGCAYKLTIIQTNIVAPLEINLIAIQYLI